MLLVSPVQNLCQVRNWRLAKPYCSGRNRLVLLAILYTSGVGRLGGCWLKPLAKLAVIGTFGRKPSGHVG